MNIYKAAVVIGMFLAAGVAAAPPGPLDGANIPANFGPENLVATQNNYTSFGDYLVTTGALAEGNETDQLRVARSNDTLYIGITGNLATNGNSWMIGINVPDRTGHSENRTEGITVCPDGPPWTIQASGREVIIHDNALIDDPSDDTWSYGADGLIFPCDTDYLFAIDIFDSTMHVNRYTLLDPAGAGAGTWDPTPGNNSDDDAVLYTNKDFVADGPVGDGDDSLFSQGYGYDEGGFDNSNLDGVTDTDGSTADSAFTGLEFAIPFSTIPTDGGPLTGSDQIQVFVLLVDGNESACIGENFGFVVNQVLPPLGPGEPCDPAGLLGLRPDLSAAMTCLDVDLSTLATFGGVAEGIFDPGDYDDTVLATQTCPTPYGDQQFDPDGIQRGGGSEMDALYVTSDAVNLYLGITGNLEENGNRMIIWLDNGIGDAGEHILTWDGMGTGGSGMEGDAMPPLESDVNTDALFDYAVAINVGGAPPNSNVYVDLWDIVGQTSSFRGFATMESGSGEMDTETFGGDNPWGMQIALNNLNNEGVLGCGFFDFECWFDSDTMVEEAAATADSGFEICIPLADIGINPCDGPANIHIWANLTGGDGWRSNQALPALRGSGQEMVWQPQNVVTDWYVNELGLPENFYRAVAVTHVTTPGIENDCDNSGVEDVCEILNGDVEDCNENATPDLCDVDSGFSMDCNTDDVPDECQTTFPNGDLDLDDAITVDDFDLFAACATEICTDPPCDPPNYVDPCCDAADFNDDGDVDILDYARFQAVFGQ